MPGGKGWDWWCTRNIAVLSDCHDHLEHLGRALEVVREEGAERLFYLGDFCAPFSLAALAEGFAGPVDAVLGNNDGDVFLLCQVAGRGWGKWWWWR